MTQNYFPSFHNMYENINIFNMQTALFIFYVC